MFHRFVEYQQTRFTQEIQPKRARKHVQHVNNGIVFRNVREVLVKDVNTTPPPP